ncbi:putative lipid II flippase FtsW [Alkalicoccobacillus porphyridii]|uniref:Probable peptidoglycan glycosyltransferase FtsW n=1 Tax=Alkalicoccobacillus porphyridii TaxID=2597270 RepID=A0A554A364_9BACI|nr:putative lipid II flippase FtsW [Alkalicoccobacillus porphyridii]TSB48115.1 putative lipid II flippase FtsW [Alkalicoccobacillus porphyridii]
MKYSFIKDNDWLLIITVFALASFGVLMVFSASYVEGIYSASGDPYFYLKRQFVWFVLASGLFIIFMHLNHQLYKKLSPAIIGVSLLLLVMVLIPGLGDTGGGAQRWLQLGPIRLQPSEFVKLGVIIYLAQVYSQKQVYIHNFVRGVLPPLIVVGIVFVLIMRQPDFGTAVSLLLVTLFIIFLSGARWIHLVGLGAVGGSLFAALAVSESYRFARLTSFVDPFADPMNKGLQLIQGYIAFAHGGLTGTGLGGSVQKLKYLPEAHTDFILAIVAEELGILGVLFVLGCYGVLLFRGVVVGTRCRTPFGSLLAFGIVFQLAIQVVFNIGAVSGLLPITGVTLPLVSNGGSSLLVTMISIAILSNISRSTIRQRRMKEEHDEDIQTA